MLGAANGLGKLLLIGGCSVHSRCGQKLYSTYRSLALLLKLKLGNKNASKEDEKRKIKVGGKVEVREKIVNMKYYC